MNCSSYVSTGKLRRMNRLFQQDGKCLLVPLDDSLISGPFDGLKDLKTKIQQIENAKPGAIMSFSGTQMLLTDASIPFILNLTASTVIGQHTKKTIISSVERAVALGADAVALHVNFSSRYESEMLSNVSLVKEKCDYFGLPLMLLAYPRSEILKDGKYIDENYLHLKSEDNAKYTDLVSHCVRIAFELGADIIKTQYTGSVESFRSVINSAVGVPVLIAGGKPQCKETLFQMIEDANSAGAAGVSIGRYVFNDKDSDILIDSIKQILFNNMSASYANEYYKQHVNMKTGLSSGGKL